MALQLEQRHHAHQTRPATSTPPGDARPAISTTFNLDAIPKALKVLPQWVVWKPEWNPNQNKWGKVPYTALGRKASSTNPNTWADLDTVAKAADESGAGIGAVVTAGGFITGIDLDKCRDPLTGNMEQWTLKIVAHFNSYSEASPSGTGLRIFIKGRIPDEYLAQGQGGKRSGKIEIYSHKRFLTVTGKALGGKLSTTVEDRQGDLDRFMAQWKSWANC